MGKLRQLETVFDDDKTTYKPGDTIAGKVIVENTETFHVKGIRAKFKGKAEVTMFVGDYDTQKERYFSKDVLLLGSLPKDEGGLVDVPPGVHEYPFKVKLPQNLPHSFNCEGDENGSVVYSVEAIIHRPGKFSYSRKQKFTIESDLDLNEFPDAGQPVQNEGEKKVASLGCNSGTILGLLFLPRRGYVPGETMDISGCVTNRSKRNIKRSFVSLQQVATLKVYGSTVVRTVKICKGCERGSVPPGQTDQWRAQPFEVPQVPPSFLRGCQLIDLKYVLKLIIVPSGLCSSLQVPVDVIIGTVPVTERPQDSTEAEDIRFVEKQLRPSRPSEIYDFGTML